MEDKTVYWDDIKRKIWLKNTWEKAKAGVKNTGKAIVNFAITRPAETVAIVGAGATLITKGTRAYAIHSENKRRDCDFYDTRTGRHSKSKRKLTPGEQVMVQGRFNNNEDYASILYDMGLLK